MPTEQQPEEAATKLPAALASATGSYAQTQMYGRGFRQRSDSTARAKDAPATDGQTPSSGRPAAGHTRSAVTDVSAGTVGNAKPGSERVQEHSLAMDEVLEQELPDQPPPDSDAPEPGLAEPEVSAEVFVACSEQDAAAARSRLVQGQQLELPPVVPPVPGMAPGL